MSGARSIFRTPWASALLAGLLALAAGGVADAADDLPAEPAGELPAPADDAPPADAPAPDAEAPTADAPDAPPGPGPAGNGDATDPGQPAGPKAKGKAKHGKSKKKGKGTQSDDGKPGETWDSYETAAPSVAEEVTKGVRVEDIVEPPSDYRYAAFGKADPFLPPMVTQEEIAKAAAATADPLEIPVVSPLQRFPLTDLKLIGIWQLANGERKAMIMTPARNNAGGEGIIVKVSDPVGDRGGKILGIGKDYLTVREFTLAPDGTRQYEDQQMYMGTRNPNDIPAKIRFKPGEKKTEVLVDDGAGHFDDGKAQGAKKANDARAAIGAMFGAMADALGKKADGGGGGGGGALGGRVINGDRENGFGLRGGGGGGGGNQADDHPTAFHAAKEDAPAPANNAPLILNLPK